MKLKDENNQYLKYFHSQEEIEIPKYFFDENSMRACWIANVKNKFLKVILSAGGAVGDKHSLYTALGNINHYNHCGKSFQSLLNCVCIQSMTQ